MYECIIHLMHQWRCSTQSWSGDHSRARHSSYQSSPALAVAALYLSAVIHQNGPQEATSPPQVKSIRMHRPRRAQSAAQARAINKLVGHCCMPVNWTDWPLPNYTGHTMHTQGDHNYTLIRPRPIHFAFECVAATTSTTAGRPNQRVLH